MNLKNLVFPAAAVAATVLSAGLTGCSNSQKEKAAAEPEAVAAFETATVQYSDSLELGPDAKVYSTLDVTYVKKGDTQLADSVNHWIASLFSNDPIAGLVGAAKPDYTTVTDMNELVNGVGSDLIAEAQNQYDIDGKAGVSVGYEFNWNIKDVYTADKYVTYMGTLYSFIGGAHGSTTFYPAVFAVADGQLYGWNMFKTDSYPALTALVKEGLMKYFDVTTESELQNCLLVDAATLPLPSSAPYLLADGVHFGYQQYEIAPYASGMPDAVVPYSSALPLMTDAAKALVE